MADLGDGGHEGLALGRAGIGEGDLLGSRLATSKGCALNDVLLSRLGKTAYDERRFARLLLIEAEKASVYELDKRLCEVVELARRSPRSS